MKQHRTAKRGMLHFRVEYFGREFYGSYTLGVRRDKADYYLVEIRDGIRCLHARGINGEDQLCYGRNYIEEVRMFAHGFWHHAIYGGWW